MLTDAQMHMIQELKLEGYTKSQIAEAFRAQGIKPPSAPTISKYYNMDVLPKNPRSRLEKNKAFDHEPYRSVIIEVLRNNSGNRHLCISSVYDVLMERFDELPANEQTLRNYVHWLEDNDIVNLEPKNERIYDHVFDTAPGDQLLIDFGQLKIGRGKEVHFICLLLRYSRYMLVYAQDHKYNSEEACRALYSAFSRINGRPATLVIDQDADFINREIYGEVFRTRIFGDFCDEQDLKLWVCHKSDPESKGPIENVVGFVKKNYFSARTLDRIDDVWCTLPGWLERRLLKKLCKPRMSDNIKTTEV